MRSARTELVLGQPFFGVLALSVDLVASEAIPTMATDGTKILYNPAFVDAISQDEVVGVVAHEVLHCANGHPWRRDAREPRKWNIACDFAINPIVVSAGLTLPTGALHDRKMSGKSAEWIYDRLPAQKVGGAGAWSSEMPGAGGCDVQDGDAGESEMAQAEWAQRVKQAAASAQAYGKLPAGCERFIDQATRPRVDWRSVMRQFVQASTREDYSWTRPNRRFLSQGYYLPSLHSERVGPVAVAIDTSGSIDSVTLNQFAAELRAIVEDVRPIRTHVLYADAAVHHIDTFEADDAITMTPKGGGGTAFGPALDAAEAFEELPCCVVYLTDLDGSHRTRPPVMPVLWVSTDPRGTAPYGDVVALE